MMEPTSAIIAAAPRQAVTAQQLAGRILAAAGAGTAVSATDRIVAGDPDTVVTGIATVAMASVDALRAAVAKGCNVVVSYDPTFWSDGDQLGPLAGTRLLAMKRAFIAAHGLVVLDLHDAWQDGIDTGMAQALGWEAHRQTHRQPFYALPRTTLLALARTLQATLGDHTLRVVGDPALPVQHVAAIWGNARQLPAITLLNGPAEVVVCGYSHEWEAVEYAQDMISAGAGKGLILLGEAKSVDNGMRHCADWIRTIVREVPVLHVPAAEPYWSIQRHGSHDAQR
jgi:hypothetical protein